jgi:HD-GYP domain-containing protein (c-di-GMP phosphodiesterase class II)
MDIPSYHHERWDGTGYPNGLVGEEIPITARLFMIVDVWDALTSDRPYRKSWSEEDALQHIKEQSEKHFDPDVVKIFVEMIETGNHHKNDQKTVPIRYLVGEL